MAFTEPPPNPPPEIRFRRQVRLRASVQEIWLSRLLIRSLAERDVRVRYKQAVLGFGWALLTPLALMLVFTLFFQRVAKVETGDVPYHLYAYLGLLPWTFFSSSVQQGGLSLVTNAPLLNKIYCPREVFPLSGVVVAAIDMAVSTLVLLLLFVIYGEIPHWHAFVLPLLFYAQVAFTVGIVLFVSVTLVYLRDVRNALPIILQVGLFATPVAYAFDSVPESLRGLYSFLNPLAPVIDGYRRTILYGEWPDWPYLGIALVSSTLFFAAGYALFKRMEGGIADVA